MYEFHYHYVKNKYDKSSIHRCFFLNNKYLRRSMNRIKNKNHRIETYEINKISLSYFDDKIYIQNS